jgi:hypothetical protein
MNRLRRLAAPLAALLALVVTGEVADLVPCADAACGVWSLVLGDTEPDTSGGLSEGPDLACLCHASFAADRAVPAVPAPEATSCVPCARVSEAVSAGTPDVPHPPPLG